MTDELGSEEASSSTAAQRNDVARFRTKELFRLFRHRGAILPPDDRGRDALFVLVATVSAIGGRDHSDLIADAFDLAPWMAPGERDGIMQMAMQSAADWTADQIALRFGVEMQERMALRLRTIGAIDFDRDARLERRAQLHRARQRERRRRQRLKPKQRPVEGRATAVLEVLPKVMEVPVKWLTDKVSHHPAFKGVKPGSLSKSIHDAIEHLKTNEAVRTEVRGLEGAARVMWVARLPRDEAEYRPYFTSKLTGFSVSDGRTAIPIWFNSERRLRERLGLDESEFTRAAIARRNELFGNPVPVRQPRRDRLGEAI